MTGDPPDELSGPQGPSNPPEPQRRNEQSHAAVLDATFAQLDLVGYHRLTFEGVAAQAGVAKTTVYRWWSSKQHLVIEALIDRCDVRPVPASGDFRADVRALVQYAIRLITQTPLGKVLPQLAAELADQPEARVHLANWLGPPRAGHQSLLYSAASQSHLPHDVDAALVLDLIGGTVLWRTLLGQKPDKQLVDQLTALIVDRTLPRIKRSDDNVL